MPIGICIKCKKPMPDSFHYFKEICQCIDWHKEAKKKGWTLRFPEDKPEHIEWTELPNSFAE